MLVLQVHNNPYIILRCTQNILPNRQNNKFPYVSTFSLSIPCLLLSFYLEPLNIEENIKTKEALEKITTKLLHIQL